MTDWWKGGPAVLVIGGILLGLGVGLMLRPQPAVPVKPNAADVGFAQDMAVHHGQALAMADFAIDRAHSGQIRSMARQIILTQASERGLLQGWLAMWKAPQLPAGEPMQWMPEHGSMHGHGGMPGMATSAQLQQLGELRGRAFDRYFALLMTRHHEGGIAMARVAQRQASIPEMRSLAAAMVRQQADEVATLSRFVRPADQ
jgi:uncharacterized protein (DUF305 family)